MPRKIDFQYHPSSDLFSHHTLDLSFRLLRNNNPELSLAIKNAMNQMKFAPSDAIMGSHTQDQYPGEMYTINDIFKHLHAETIVEIVAALTHIGQRAVDQKNLPTQHLTLLRGLIEDWAKLAEWILQHATLDRDARQ